MSHVFGDKNKFAVEYTLLGNKWNEYGVIGESWGELRLWIKDQDICESTINGEIHTLQWNLYYMVEWFCDHLFHVFGFDPYPLPIEGGNTLEKEEKAAEFENIAFAKDEYKNIDEQIEFDIWFDAKMEWYRKHLWNGAGCTIADVYFSRIDNIAEIMWNNQSRNSKVEFSYKQGVYHMPHKEFRDIIISFLCTIIKELDLRCGNENETNEWKQKMKSFLCMNPFE